MSPISNVKILKYTNELTSKVDKLSDIVTYQTKLIQELKTDNNNLINLINTEFNKLLLKNTNYYLNKKHPNNINNIFYKTRQLVKTKKIINTWVFNNKVYISTDKKSRIVITDTTQLTYYTKVNSNI